MKPTARPTREVRFYAAGAEVTPEQFWEAVRAAGGQAVVTAHDPKPLEGPGYRLTAKGAAAVREAAAAVERS